MNAETLVRVADGATPCDELASIRERSGTAESLPAASASERKRILAVDDSASYLEELSAGLGGASYEIVCARSGDEALETLAAQALDCVLLNLVMTELDGIETCRRIKSSPPFRDIPLIMLTEREDRDAMLEALANGADDVIAKSAGTEVLTARVRAQLRRKQLEDEHRLIHEKLLRSELEAIEARAAHRLAEERAKAVETLEQKNRELSAAYSELQRTQSRLVQSAKLASLGELVAGVAHEINNPLAFALSHLETARDSVAWLVPVPPDDRRAKHWHRAQDRLEEIAGGLERIRELVLKLRTFSRLDEGQRKMANVRESVESALTILGHRLRGRVQVDLRFSPPTELDCYPSLLNQALMNLVSNALDAIEGRGVKATGRVTIEGLGLERTYVLRVIDDGVGIPAELRERVLDPFFTTKEVGKGTGLGLSITDSIVKKHGGHLEILPAPGGGTVAELRLPLSGPPTPERV